MREILGRLNDSDITRLKTALKSLVVAIETADSEAARKTKMSK
ncbi:MAG TPA: hypothetical protein VEH58_04410 [Dehalococcoidales bacterium]|nr:hypothetical protein [Dehalococcoidales bacterium]